MIPGCQITCIGEISAWGTQFLNQLKSSQVAEVNYSKQETDFQNQSSHQQFPLIFLEHLPENKVLIEKILQGERKLLIALFGKNFSKEEVLGFFQNQVAWFFESVDLAHPSTQKGLKYLSAEQRKLTAENNLLRSLKSILIQNQDENDQPLVQEIKTGVTKLEALIFQKDEATQPKKDTALFFYKLQTLVDCLLTIHELDRSGQLSVKSKNGDEGLIEFIQGKIYSAATGRVVGLKAIYRMFTWDAPEFSFTRGQPQEDKKIEENISASVRNIVDEGERLKERFEKIRKNLPPFELRVDLLPAYLTKKVKLEPDLFLTLSSVIEFKKVDQVVDFNPLPDVIIYESLIELRKNKLIAVC